MNEIYFSQIREDSLIERTILERIPKRRILCIGSGGCTAFSLLRDDVELVTTVDFSRAQCALIELKLKAMKHLSRDEFLEFIGETHRNHVEKFRLDVFHEIRGELSRISEGYWSTREHQIERGVNSCGVTERFYRFVAENLRLNMGAEEYFQELFSCNSIDQQVHLLDSIFSAEAWMTAIRLLFSKTTQSLFYPEFWYADSGESDFADFFAERFKKELSERLIKDNYFLSQLVLGRYLLDQPNGTPHYLSKAGYEEARRNTEKLQLINSTLQDCLKSREGWGAYFLSNVFDWGASKNIRQIAHALMGRSTPGDVLLYRNMYSPTIFPAEFLEIFKVDASLSCEMHSRDRSLLYRHLTVGQLN